MADPAARRRGPAQALAHPLAALAALSLLFFVVTSGTFSALGVVLPDMLRDLKWSWAEAGLGYTLLGVSCGLASFAPAVVIRLAGVRLTLLTGAAVMAVGYLLIARLPAEGAAGPRLFEAACALLGVGFALAATIPATFVLTHRFARAPRAFAAYFTAGALGAAAGPLIYPFLFGHAWTTYWIAAAAAVMGGGVLAALTAGVDGRAAAPALKDHAVAAPEDGFSVREAIATPQFWIVTAAYTAYLLCETSVNGLSVAHLTQHGIAPALAAGALSLQAVANALARAGAGPLAERVGARTLVMGALALVVIGIAALAEASSLPLVGVYVVGVGVGYGVSNLAATLLLLQYFGRRRNLELFSLMCLVSTLAAAGPWLGGYVRDRFGGFGPAFALFAAVAVAVLAAVALMRPPRALPSA